MTEAQTGRFKDALWFPKEEVELIIGGAGGIGSWLTLLLARAGFLPIVFDFDTYEVHNMGGQLCKESSVGKSKVEALAEVVKEFTSTDISTFNEKYTKDSIAGPYMFSGFDNMQARKDMFASWYNFVEEWKNDDTLDAEERAKEPIFIDGRLTAEQIQIFCVTPDKIGDYKEHLFDDSEVEDAPCTMKQTSHAAAMIASKMVGYFTNHYTNVVQGDKLRNIPFLHECFIPIDFSKSS